MFSVNYITSAKGIILPTRGDAQSSHRLSRIALLILVTGLHRPK